MCYSFYLENLAGARRHCLRTC